MHFLINKIKSLNIYLYKITELIGIILLFSIFIMMVIEVIFRHTVGYSLLWVEETSTLFFVWACLIGASLGLKDRSHLGVTVFINFFPSSIRNGARLVTDCLIGFFAGYLLIYGWKIAEVLGVEQRTPFLGIPYTYMYLSVSVGGFLLTIQALFLIKDDIKNFSSSKTSKQ